MKSANSKIIETSNGIFTLRPATTDDAKAINSIMADVYAGLDNKELFVVNPPEWVNRILSTPEEGFAVVAEMVPATKKKPDSQNPESAPVVGFFFIWYPGSDSENLGLDIGLPENELCKVAHAESACVLPIARGNRLESHMIEYAESFIDPQSHPYLLATVSPYNPASYKSAEANGYRLIMTKEKYGGVMRRIYLKELPQ